MNNHKILTCLAQGITTVAIVVLLFVGANIPVQADPGDIDLNFGVDGKVVTDIDNASDDRAYDVIVRTDGKIIATGYTTRQFSHEDFVIVRYNEDGSVDNSFGDNGKVITQLSNEADVGYAIALQSDEKMVVAGRSGDNVAVVRYNEDGSLDTSFGTSGKVIADVGLVWDVIIQSDGKIIVGGTTGSYFLLLRYNDDGSLDNTFGNGGRVSGVGEYVRALAIQADGKIVAAGRTASHDFAVARYSNDGTLDNTFGGGGIVVTDIEGNCFDDCFAVAIQADGKIVAAGYASVKIGGHDAIAIVRYNNNGTLDTGFGVNGKVTTFISDGGDRGYDLIIQSDGKIVIAGSCNAVFVTVRYDDDGSLDTSFGIDGKTITWVGTAGASGQAVVQAKGKIVVGGYSSELSHHNIALVRYFLREYDIYFPIMLKN